MTAYHLFDETPALPATDDAGPLSLGTEFYVTGPAWLTELRYLQPVSGGSPQQCTAALYWTGQGNGLTGELAAGPLLMPAPVAGEWVTVKLPTPFLLVPYRAYRTVIFHPGGYYAATSDYFNGVADRVTGPLVRPSRATAQAELQGSYHYADSITFTDAQFNGGAYYSDVTVTDVDPALPPPVLEGDVSLEAGQPRGNGFFVRDKPANLLTVGAPRGYVFTTSEATQ